MDEVSAAHRDYPIIEVRGNKFSGVRDRTLYESLTRLPAMPLWITISFFVVYATVLLVIETTVHDPAIRSRLSLLAQPTIVMAPWLLLVLWRSSKASALEAKFDPRTEVPRPSSASVSPFYVTINVSRAWWSPTFRDTGWFWRDGGELRFRGALSTFALSSHQIQKIKLGAGSLEFRLNGEDLLTKGSVQLQLHEPSSPTLTLLQEEFRVARNGKPSTEVVWPALLELGPSLSGKQVRNALISLASLMGLILYSIFVFSRLKGAPMDESQRFIVGVVGIMFLVVAAVIALVWVQEAKRKALEQLLRAESTITHQRS